MPSSITIGIIYLDEVGVAGRRKKKKREDISSS